jgi:uncharacterized membrane protein
MRERPEPCNAQVLKHPRKLQHWTRQMRVQNAWQGSDGGATVTLTVGNRYAMGSGKTARSSKTNIGNGERLASIFTGAALALYGLSRRNAGGTALALAGGGLLARGLSGFSLLYRAMGIDTADSPAAGTGLPQSRTILVDRSILINRSPEELYRHWRNFENLPGFMKHLELVQVFDEKRSHWVAKAPMGQKVEWDAEIIDEVAGESIAWRSTEKADIKNAGSVHFSLAPTGRGTLMRVLISYDPPAGQVGRLYLSLFGEEPSQQVAEDLRRFKAMMEAGEIATTEGQPSARRNA